MDIMCRATKRTKITAAALCAMRTLDDFARIDGCAIKRAPKQLLKGNNPVPVVQKQAAKDFVFETHWTGTEIVVSIST